MPCATSAGEDALERAAWRPIANARARAARRTATMTAAHADEAELLGDHREQEIGVRLGQVEQLLDARAQARRRTIRRGRRRSASATAGSPCRADRAHGSRKRDDALQRGTAQRRSAARSATGSSTREPEEQPPVEAAEEQDAHGDRRRSRRTRRSRARQQQQRRSPPSPRTSAGSRGRGRLLACRTRPCAPCSSPRRAPRASFMSSEGWKLMTPQRDPAARAVDAGRCRERARARAARAARRRARARASARPASAPGTAHAPPRRRRPRRTARGARGNTTAR